MYKHDERCELYKLRSIRTVEICGAHTKKAGSE